MTEEEKSDIYGHLVNKGEPYIEGVYLEKLDKESKDKVFYKTHKKKVYVHPEEIFHPAVPINENDLSLDKSEYQFLSSCFTRK